MKMRGAPDRSRRVLSFSEGPDSLPTEESGPSLPQTRRGAETGRDDWSFELGIGHSVPAPPSPTLPPEYRGEGERSCRDQGCAGSRGATSTDWGDGGSGASSTVTGAGTTCTRMGATAVSI